MTRIKRALNLTATISTGTLIACIVWYGIALTLHGKTLLDADIPYITLGEILLLGTVCGTATELILPDRDVSSKEGVIRLIIHGVFITSAVLVLGLIYGWYEFSIDGVLLMCLTSAVIYAVTYFVNFRANKKIADEMTERLNEMKQRKGQR